MFGRSGMSEFIADDGAGVGYKGTDDVFLETQGEIEVRPGFVAVFEDGHAEYEIMHILDVALAFAFVGEAEDDARDFDVCQGHVVGGAGEHQTQVVGGLL